jgi:putative transposase
MRTIPFIQNGFYHVYNRGVDRRTVFFRFGHYLRFQQTIRSILLTGSAAQRLVHNQSLALNSKVDLLAYCLMPNHYHLLIYQKADGGITEFMQKLDTSYTKYFNLNNNRIGHLFEHAFRAKIIEADEVLLHVSRYIHLNPVIKHLVDVPQEWRWSSYQEYITPTPNPLCETGTILNYFTSPAKYREFVESTIARNVLIHDAALEKDEDTLFL